MRLLRSLMIGAALLLRCAAGFASPAGLYPPSPGRPAGAPKGAGNRRDDTSKSTPASKEH